jgi:class 3 adenylate cyclase
MNILKITELQKLAMYRLSKGLEYLNEPKVLTTLNENYEAKFSKSLNEESEIPKYEKKKMPFNEFKNEKYVVMMTDIRKSVRIINSLFGTRNMFLIFYSYSATVANIVDSYNGTSTEFLGDGVLNLFDCDAGLENTIRNSYKASKDILYATQNILNPIYNQLSIPSINIGIGIDYGITIVTRFGYKSDNDLKAFGKCIHNVSRLCKGDNEILVSSTVQKKWPESENGKLVFCEANDADNNIAYIPYIP